MKTKLKIFSFLGFAIFTVALLVQDIGFSSNDANKKNSTAQFFEISKSFFSKPDSHSSSSHSISGISFIEELEEGELFNKKNTHPITLLSDFLHIFHFKKQEESHPIISQTFTLITSFIHLYIKNCIYLI